jgi:hypothetical protein
MDMPRLSKSVKRITVLQRNASGDMSPVVVFKRGRGKKNGTQMLRPLERIMRSLAETGDAATGTYLRQHKKSNRKRKDGWVRDVPGNYVKAARKGIKELRPAAILGL